MPGLEAMAAGAMVISSDAGGNRAYCRFGENCIEVGMERCRGLHRGAGGPARGGCGRDRAAAPNGYETVGRHTLENERECFAEFMGGSRSAFAGSVPGWIS